MCWFLKLCQTCISIIATNHTSRSCSNSIVPPRKFLKINRPEKNTQVYSSFNLKTKMPKYQIYLLFSGRSLEIFVDERLNESQNTRLTPATSANSDGHNMSSAGLRHLSRVLDFPVYCTKRFKYVNFAQTFPRNFCYYFK